jgi:hypothetical protein
MATHDEHGDEHEADAAPSRGAPPEENPGRVTVRGSLVGRVQARKALVTGSGAGAVVAGEDATLSASFAGAVVAGRDMVVTAGGGQFLVAGGDITLTTGGAQILVAGGDVDATNLNGGVLVARRVSVERGIVGVLVARDADLGNARVLLNTPQAAALGAVLGLVAPVVAFLLHRSFRRRKGQDAVEKPRAARAKWGRRLLRFLLGMAIPGGVTALVVWRQRLARRPVQR